MPHREMTAEEVKALLDRGDGYVYVDVRSTVEFRQSHPVGAHNIPLLEPNGATRMMEPNPDFERAILGTFPPGAKLVLGCSMGGRSRAACDILSGRGYADLVNMSGGFSGAYDPFGTVIQEGWLSLGYPCASGDEGGVSYASILARIPGA